MSYRSFIIIIPSKCQRITSIASRPSGDSFLTGGLDGEVDYWFRKDDWRCNRLRDKKVKRGFFSVPDNSGDGVTYKPTSIVGICYLSEDDLWISVAANGELILWRENEICYSWQLPEPGSPRSIAAHPYNPWIAVGIKKGGFANPNSAVVLVEVPPL